ARDRGQTRTGRHPRKMIAALLTFGFAAAVVRITVPYALAALGGTLSERSGVINIALEGLLLTGAFCATLGAFYGHGALAGILGGVAGGVVVAALYALLVVKLGGDQIVCGVALNLFADGMTRFWLKATFDSSSNSPRIDAWGHVAAPLIVLTIALVALVQLVVYRTPFGLRLRAVGEHPEAARSLGVDAARVRWQALLLAGALAGLGGAWLAADQRQFVAGMSNGRGYIALAAMIFGHWRPARAAAACLLFGLAEALQIALQAAGVGVPGWAVQMLPYALTMVTLAGFIGRATPPAALGRPEDR
ncbi:MAG TPA: ABC transporter permease, partial [Polyangia bacterium]|nr:ABC transporter permease [Polyangia bacterium]